MDWIAERAERSEEFFDLPENVKRALSLLGDELGVDARRRAREFPAEADRFRRQRLAAAGLPPKAQLRLKSILKVA